MLIQPEWCTTRNSNDDIISSLIFGSSFSLYRYIQDKHWDVGFFRYYQWKQIPNFLPDKYIQIFFDLQGRTGTTLDRFLWWLASEIVRTLKREHDIKIPKPDPKAFEDTDYFINEFLPSLRPVLGDSVLLLTFDEFDTLDRPEIQETLSRPLINYLRRLIEVEGLNFIFSIGSSGDKLENMQASYTDFFKSALYRKISFLTSDDSQRLITKPVAGAVKVAIDGAGQSEGLDFTLDTSSGASLASTRIDLSDQTDGPYLLDTDALGSTSLTIYIDNDLAAHGNLGIIDIFWETPQDTVPVGGLNYTMTFKKQ